MANILDLVKMAEERTGLAKIADDTAKMSTSQPWEKQILNTAVGNVVGKESEIRDMGKTILEVFGEKSKDSDELIASTLQAILNMQRGESEDVLYKAETKGGDERYIHRNIQGLPTDQRRAWQANMLREQIEQDPTFADTLSYEAGRERLDPQEGIMKKLAKLLGL